MTDENNENCDEWVECKFPHIFQHVDLFKSIEKATTIDLKKLINIINHLHFTDRPLFILLKHPTYQNSLLVKSHPEPCIGSQLTCRWDESFFRYKLESHIPLCIIITSNPFVIIIPYNQLSIDSKSFTISLPNNSYILNHRQYLRYPCRDVLAELTQSDFVVTGTLVDFSSTAFRVKADSEKLQHNFCFNPDGPVSVRLFSNEMTIYSESCKCIRWQDGGISKEFVFTSEIKHVSRFPSKKIRNPRRQINPPLTAVFEHPFNKRKILRDIFDISSSGFSLRNKPDEDIFFPGITIHNFSIQVAGISIAKCVAQIVYRRNENNDIHYGFAILDMDIHSYSRINHILGVCSDSMISISTEVDTDTLWNFFFQTGFIYPEKYGRCHSYRKELIETYRKLYQENPEIARHITYKNNGQIFGHISMIRAYERTWLLHHYASRSYGERLAGFAVLRQMMFFTHGMYQFPSSRMDYVISYFRPENKFPNRVFGGFARDFNNPQGCSLDLFTYLTLPISVYEKEFPQEWRLRESNSHDLWELNLFYRHHSGGLLMNILGFGDYNHGCESIENAFNRLGFLRKCRIYALDHKGYLKAVFIVNQSDLAINLSNLLNSIKVLTIDPLGLPPEVLIATVSKLGKVYNLDKITLLLYPSTDNLDWISYKKQYYLWIGDMRFMNQFMDYVQKKFRMKYD